MGSERHRKLTAYTIEECTSCGQKTKRPFKSGDYVYNEGGNCAKCGMKMRVIMIFGEEVKEK